MDEDRRGARQHIVGVQGADGEVVGRLVLVEVADCGDGDCGAVGLAQLGAEGEVVGVDPAVVAGVPEGVVPGGGEGLGMVLAGVGWAADRGGVDGDVREVAVGASPASSPRTPCYSPRDGGSSI